MVNKVILLGRAGKDPEVRHMDNNLTVARFPLATSEFWTKDGNRSEHTEWHNIVMWRGLAKVAEDYVRKGTLLYIEGRLRTRAWDDKDGNKRYTTEILADVMNLVGPKQDSHSGDSPAQASGNYSAPSVETTNLDTAPDDLPF
ncbi:MAG: single-stranded DNA-binding protein [Bacteroidales bacterium]|jgi:single-strand DNA-binding protein|nr:single-stranded DNA-binding protein [Bacteroidales bacterium]